MLKNLSISRTETEYKSLLKNLNNNINEEFEKYLKHYLDIKSKWVFCFMPSDHRLIRTNMHVESFHRTLKYQYLNGKKNKRVDMLLYRLLECSEDFQYKMRLHRDKGVRTTFKRKITERHNLMKQVNMNILENFKIQVLFLLIVFYLIAHNFLAQTLYKTI